MRMVTCIDLSYTTYKRKSLENSSYINRYFFVKNKDWGRGGGGVNRRGLINFPPLKRGGRLLERGGFIEDLRYYIVVGGFLLAKSSAYIQSGMHQFLCSFILFYVIFCKGVQSY